MDLAEEIFNITRSFPKEEKYGIISQMRRCTVSIPSNISEGDGRNTNRHFKYFLEISMGSCNELQTQLELVRRFKYLSDVVAFKIADELLQIFKMILVFFNSLSDD
jgi:four helix bundle protein